jgi:hypothetical protein
MWHAKTHYGCGVRNTARPLMTAAVAVGVGALALAGPPGRSGEDTAEQMCVRTFPLDESRHVLLIVDPILRHVAIYHVDTVAGTLTLKSSRDISGDLRIGDFNAQDPKPAALRKMLEISTPATQPRPSP